MRKPPGQLPSPALALLSVAMIKRLTLTFLMLAGPAFAQERQWFLDSTEDDAYLIFGVPDSDDVGISFWCTLGSGEIRLFVPETDPDLKPEQTVAYTIEAGPEKFSLEGRTMPNEEAASTSVETALPADAPLFAALQKADRFSVRAGASVTIYPLTDADLEGLIRMCRKA